MGNSFRNIRTLLPVLAALGAACSNEPQGSGGSGGNSIFGGTSSATGGSRASGGTFFGLGGAATGQGGQSLGGASTVGGSSTTGGTSATSNGGTVDAAGAASGGTATGGIGAAGASAAGAGGLATGGRTSIGGSAAAGSSSGGAATGGTATGGTATGGTATGGTATGGTATGGSSSSEAYLINGVHGRIDVTKINATENVTAFFFDQPMRMDAFAPYQPELHQVVLQGGACTLLKAGVLACNPVCGSTQYCGTGNVCKTSAVLVTAGTITVQGPSNNTSLVPTGASYPLGTLPPSNISASASIAANAPGSSWSSTGFTISSLGVDDTGIGLPATGSDFTLKDGGNVTLSWNAITGGTVQLLLNSGWHGATPVATLICEVPASAGQLVIPQTLVEAYPAAGGFGLMQHTSTISLVRRARTTTNGRIVELVVTGYRAVVYPIH